MGKKTIAVLLVFVMLYGVFMGAQGETPASLTPTPGQTPTIGFKVPIQIGVDFDYDSQNASKVMSGFKITFENVDPHSGGWHVITGQSGYVETSAVSGCYDITISKSNYLEKTIKNVWIYPGTCIGKYEPVMMQAGDLTRDGAQDGVVNMADIMELAKSFNRTWSDEGFNKDCDFNGDGAVNMADVMIMAKNYNKTVNTQPIDISGQQISITTPQENNLLAVGTNISIITTEHINETVNKVEFFTVIDSKTEKVGEDTESPYICSYRIQHTMPYEKRITFFVKMTTASGVVYRSNNVNASMYMPTPTPTMTPPWADRTLELEAEGYNESAGVINNGTYITSSDQSMIVYKNVNFNRFPIPFTDSLAIIYASAYAKNIPSGETSTVEFRLDSKDGILLGTINLNSNTSGEFSSHGKRFECWNYYYQMTGRYHDLYILFKGATQVGDFDKFKLDFSYIIGPTITPTPTSTPTSTPTPAPYKILEGYTVVNGGKVVLLDVPPIEYNGEILLPLRPLVECLQLNCEWNAQSQKLTMSSSNGDTMVMTVGSNQYTFNGLQDTMKSPLIVIDGRTRVPAQVVVETFGGLFNVDTAAKTITIN